MKLNLTIFVLMINLYGFGQITSVEDKEKNLAFGANVLRTFDNRYEGTEGSPYLNDNWLEGDVILRSGIKQTVPIKYDIYKDQVEAVLSSGDSIILFSRNIDSFIIHDPVLGSTTFKYIGHDYSETVESSDYGFYQVLFDGATRLLAKKRVVLMEADYEGAYSAGKTYDEFVKKGDDYYFWLQDDTLKKIKLNKKNIISYFEDQPQVQSYIKSNKIKFKEVQELVNVLQYFENNQ